MRGAKARCSHVEQAWRFGWVVRERERESTIGLEFAESLFGAVSNLEIFVFETDCNYPQFFMKILFPDRTHVVA
jgi:hypothetical protein